MVFHRARTQQRATTVYLILRMLQAAVLIVYLLGSLLLAGGDVVAAGSPMWGAVVDFPLFSIPGWVMLTVSIIGVLLVVPVLATARTSDAGRINGAFSATAAATVATFTFTWALPAGTAGEATLRRTATVVDGTVLAVLLVVSGILAARYDRRRRKEGLPVWLPGEE